MTGQTSDLDILLPDRTLQIAGADITVHEYTFMQGLQISDFAKSFIDELTILFLTEDQFSLSRLDALFGRHPEIIAKLLSLATGQPVHWVEALSDGDGQLLLKTWWSVNAPFFVQRLAQEMGARQAEKRLLDDPLLGASVSQH